MIKVDNRESAHVRSRVKDLSVVPNVATYNALLACITPISKLPKDTETGLYEPVLVRDNETLIATFGDPRIDPEKYIDLYSVMQIVGNGGTCYVAKVNSGTAGVYQFPFVDEPIIQGGSAGDSSNFALQKESGNSPVYTCSGLNNKYVVTGVRGYKDKTVKDGTFYTVPYATASDEVTDTSSMELPDGEYTDYTGKYTWECTPNADGTFTLKVTMSGEVDADESLVVIGSVDSAWGSEPILLRPVTEGYMDDSAINFDNTNDTLAYQLVSTSELKHEYIISEQAKEKLKKELTISDGGNTYIPELSFEYIDRKLYVTVTLRSNSGFISPGLAFTVIGLFKDPESDGKITLELGPVTRSSKAMIAYSSMAEDLQFSVYLSQAKPYSIRAYYLHVDVKNSDGTNTLGTAKIKLESTTTNQGLVNALNSAIGTVVHFELIDPETASACMVKERGENSIVQAINDRYIAGKDKLDPNPQMLLQPVIVESPSFRVDVNDYINALQQYKEKKYVGCLMSDMVCPVTHDSESPDKEHSLYPLDSTDRRTLHYYLKDIARERKDSTVILSTPYTLNVDNKTALTINDACDWVASQGSFVDLWEYGQGATTDYATQSFYLEMYYSWLEMSCTWIVNGTAKTKKVKVAPSNLVLNNILTSWRTRGIQYPVAGDQGGILPDTCKVLMNPKTKLERDQLVQYRINPIWDTGTRGIQILGNETLNAGYTDLNAAHIARLLVYIRNAIDEYTEQLKFSINNLVLWDQWRSYVAQRILEPLVSSNALKEYSVAMGRDTTTDEEISNRRVNGKVSLIFNQSAEVFDLEYTVYSSSTTIEEASTLI